MVTRLCALPNCGAEFHVKFPSDRRRYCSRSCGVKSHASGRDGALNPNWWGGTTSHDLYDVYLDMIGRCHRPTHQRYADYGGRGIAVCARWRADFWAFVADMGERPVGLTLDRIDNDGGYGPGNCRWATYKEQRHNRRSQRRRTHCPNDHLYTPENTRISPKGYQECITCSEATRARWGRSPRQEAGAA